ncbi:RHGBA-like protein [Mya arenaria]|uniref:RHGBA-like protein n=1 Tax=Mya arenaria TaxID=6604 RepID=A0ABY7FFZ3_MYAAR|nr:RHGBA-like protein [Mya arenaria]
MGVLHVEFISRTCNQCVKEKPSKKLPNNLDSASGSFKCDVAMKHISLIDNKDNLQALIRHELRELGVKVPKPKKAKRAASKLNQDVNKGQLFGNYLGAVHCVHVPECGYVAKFLVDAAKIISANIDNEGVFRKSGAVSRQKELKLENGKGFMDANVYDVTALVKQFFRELPEPLFTSVYHDTFVRCYQLENSEEATRAVLLACLLLPSEHATTLQYIMKLLAKIATHSEKNKMDSTNLAVVLAPNLMHMNSKSETMKSSEEKLLQVQTAIVELLIKQANLVCLVEDEMIEKTAFMSEVFSTDDELDASFVSSIAQSITKWRRSTDGKTNTSGISQASNASQVSGTGSYRQPVQTEDGAYENRTFQFAAGEATPVMRRPKNAPSTDGRAFSASKKKAILNQLPQHSALASTPFTPASTMKPHPGTRRPVTSRPARRQSPRESSVVSAEVKATRSSNQVGHRLAGSPSSTVSAPVICSSSQSKSITDDSPIAALVQSSFSSSVCEQSTMSHVATYEDDRHSLNEGFIINDEKEGDITRIMSEPAISGSHEKGEYVMISDVLPRESVSESMLGESRIETPRNHGRSFSVDSTLEGSMRKGSLKRGQPNSLKAGLLQGDQSEVHKLRRSFGFDRSDIGFPMSDSVANTSDDGQYVQLDCSLDYLTEKNPADMTVADLSMCKDDFDDSPGSVSRIKSTTSLVSTKSEMNEGGKDAGYVCDDESEACSKTGSGMYKLFHKNKQESEPMDVDSVNGDIFKLHDDMPKSLAQQKQESKDSLLSEASSSLSPLQNFKEREMTRSVSADSGQGSICDETRIDSVDATPESITSGKLTEKERVGIETMHEFEKSASDALMSVADETCRMSDNEGDIPVFDESQNDQTWNESLKPGLVQKKSLSTQHLDREFEPTPTRVSRSKSLLEASLMQKKANVKPNLQISAETHKLLARAGYIKEHKVETKSDFDDFAVPGKFPFIQQAEALNPRRESIIQLQKNKAGFVRQNIRQFDRISEDKKEVDDRHASPLRFANSTSRKMKPPMVFHKPCGGFTKEVDGIRQTLNFSKDKMHFGTAKVPISTQLIKPSDPLNTTTDGKSTGLKRKPSIYYAEKDADRSVITNTGDSDSSMDFSSAHSVNESRFEHEVGNQTSDGKPELDLSITNAINSVNVCSPLNENVKTAGNEDKANVNNKENTGTPTKMPDIKQPILTTPISLESVKFRTASNKTPIELIKSSASKSPRSPIKPLKRLGSSPHSPRNRVIHSPKMIKTNRRSLLSTIPNQNEDFNSF